MQITLTKEQVREAFGELRYMGADYCYKYDKETRKKTEEVEALKLHLGSMKLGNSVDIRLEATELPKVEPYTVVELEEEMLCKYESTMNEIVLSDKVYEYLYIFSPVYEFPLLHPVPFSREECKDLREKNHILREEEIKTRFKEFKEKKYSLEKLIKLAVKEEHSILGEVLAQFYCDGLFDEKLFILGLKRGIVQLEPHDKQWDEAAIQTIKILKSILGDDAIDIQHIGSTAIPAIKAKPIIDIVVGVTDFDKVMLHNEQLRQVGIFYRGSDVERQLLYVMGDMENDTRTHHIHIVKWNETEWKNYIHFRDYLNDNENMALQYQKVKEELESKYADDRVAYTNGKQDMIDLILDNQ